MKTKIVTSILLIVSLSFWLVWDVVVATNAIKGDTISEITLATSYVATFIPSAWGIICGHLFWPAKEIEHKWLKIKILWGWGVLILVINVFQLIPGNMTTVPIFFLVNFIVGHFLWPQKVAPKS
jgi:hypothetical protein